MQVILVFVLVTFLELGFLEGLIKVEPVFQGPVQGPGPVYV